MKKTKMINSLMSASIAKLGHTDLICLADAGLPIPSSVERIDIALELGVPSFLQTLKVIASESFYEEAFFSKDVMDHFPSLVDEVKVILGNDKLKVSLIPHEEFKNMTSECKSIIRTGENKWFHNVILKSGVTF